MYTWAEHKRTYYTIKPGYITYCMENESPNSSYPVPQDLKKRQFKENENQCIDQVINLSSNYNSLAAVNAFL